MDELATLPYLDMVVKESLRIHPPVPMTDRVAIVDTYIPLSKPFMDKYGQMQDGIRYAFWSIFIRDQAICSQNSGVLSGLRKVILS